MSIQAYIHPPFINPFITPLLPLFSLPQSRRQPPRIPHKKRREPNVRQVQEKLQYTIQTQSPSPVRRAPIPKRVRVMPKPLALGI